MPMIQFSADDLSRGRVLTPGWYLMKIEGVGEKPSKDGGSTNFPVDGRVIKNVETGSTEFEGAIVTWNFNSKAIGFARGFLEAFGQTVEAKRYDLDAAKGGEIEVFVENDTYNGNLVNRVNHKYRKAGSTQG